MTLLVDVDRVSLEQLRAYEIEEARTLQRAMVPLEPLCLDSLEIASHFRPASAVGGDFLDYFLLSDGTIGIYVGDVVGKGLPAAFYAALAVGTLRGINKTGQSPSSVLELLNKRLRTRAIPGRFCSVQYAVFDPTSRILQYANAGLPGPIHISGRVCQELRQGGLPSGLFEGSRYELRSLHLEPGDAVLFMTDGLTDALNTQEEEFGIDQLLQICAPNGHRPADTLLKRVFGAVDIFAGGHPQYDDMTAAVLKVHGCG